MAAPAASDFRFIDQPGNVKFTVNEEYTKMTCRVEGTPRPLYRARCMDPVTRKCWYWNPSRANQDRFKAAIHAALDTRATGSPFSPASDRPVSVVIKFFLPRPMHHYDNHWGLLNSAPDMAVKIPDLDNLEKLVIDAMQGLIYNNDKVVCLIKASKHFMYTDAGKPYRQAENQEGCTLISIIEHNNNSIINKPKID